MTDKPQGIDDEDAARPHTDESDVEGHRLNQGPERVAARDEQDEPEVEGHRVNQ